jgi:LPS-assembly lipoprotein
MNAQLHSPTPLPAVASSDRVGQVPRRRPFLRRAAGVGALLVFASALTGCGFALRQAPNFGFNALYVTQNAGSPVSKALQRELSASGIQVAAGAPAPGLAGAVVLNVVIDRRERAVVGQTSNGQVRELELRYRFRYSLSTPAGKRLIEENELLLERDISFSETAALAKAAEEQLMFKDMEGDVVQQVMRRLASVKSL